MKRVTDQKNFGPIGQLMLQKKNFFFFLIFWV